MSKSIDLSNTVKQKEDIVSANVDDEVMLLSVEQGYYYNMKLTGGRIWSLIEKPITVHALCEILAKEYQVDPSVCQKDVIVYLNNLLEENLIDIVS